MIMDDVLFVSICSFIFLTLYLILVLKSKNTPKGDRIIAWVLYVFSIIGLVTANLFL